MVKHANSQGVDPTCLSDSASEQRRLQCMLEWVEYTQSNSKEALGRMYSTCQMVLNNVKPKPQVKGNLDAIRALIEVGVSVNIRDDKGQTAMSIAFSNGNLEAMELLLNAGADINEEINENGESYLHQAVLKNNLDLIRFVLRHGASVSDKDKFGLNPMQKAVLVGNVDVMELLKENGADINVKDSNGWTLLHCAARCGRSEAAQWLLDNGLSIDKKCYSGYTPLHLAAKSGQLNIVRILLDQGAKIDTKDSIGFTPLQLAIYFRHIAIVKVLQSEKKKNKLSLQQCSLS